MTTREEKLEAMLKDFEKRTHADKNKPAENLRHVLDSSPDLKERILQSIEKNQLKKFELLPANANAGGSYDPDHHAMNLPKDKLDIAGKDKAAAAELVFVTGHEIQHALNNATYVASAETKFAADAWKMANGPGPHDYTAAIKEKLQVNRRNEAEANLGGFNALASQVHKDNPKATLGDVYKANPFRMKDFIDVAGTRGKYTYTLKSDLTLDHDKVGKSIMHLSFSGNNVEAMGKHYFDKKPADARLGAKGDQDYKHYYANGALSAIELYEKTVNAAHKKADPKYAAPGVSVNLKELGLDKVLLHSSLHYVNTTARKAAPTIADAGQPAHQKSAHAKGPFGDPTLDQAFHAMQTGGEAQLSIAAQQMLDSPAGRQIMQTGNDLLAQQQRQEQPAPAQQTQLMPAETR